MENSTPPEYTPACRIQRLAELETPGTRRRDPDGVWWAVTAGRHVACGRGRLAGSRWWMLANIMTSVDFILWTLSLARILLQDLTMSHGHGVPNCSFRFCRLGLQLDLGECRSPSQCAQRNPQPVSCRCWGYVYAFSPGLMVLMVTVMIVIVMVLALVLVMVPKALSQVGWLHQRQCRTINWYKPSLGQSFHKLRIPATQRFLWKRYSCRSLALSSAALKQALKHALK